METRQLRHFLAVADAGTFTAAAERLHITQPGLSSSIQALERALATKLFVRTRKRVDLTEAGRELYVGARRALATLEAVESSIRHGPRLRRATLKVGSIPSFAGLDLAGLISRFVAQNPEVNIAVTVGLPAQLLAELAADTIELAFVTMPLEPPDGFELTPLAAYPMMLACPIGHRLARQRSVGVRDLAEETFIDFPPGQHSRQLIDRAFTDARVERTTRVTCNEITALLELVAHGLGVALVPSHLAMATRVPVALIPLENVSLVYTVAVATRVRGVTSDVGRAMWSLLTQMAQPISAAE